MQPFDPGSRSLPEADKWALSDFVVRRLVPVVGTRPFPPGEPFPLGPNVAYFPPAWVVERGPPPGTWHWGTRWG